MRLSHVFVWRGKARYWDADPSRQAAPRRAIPRRPAVNVREGTYVALVLEAKRRGSTIQSIVDEVFRDL